MSFVIPDSTDFLCESQIDSLMFVHGNNTKPINRSQYRLIKINKGNEVSSSPATEYPVVMQTC